MDQKFWLQLYRCLIRPHVEYAVNVWCPYLDRDIEVLEKVQRHATKLLPGIRTWDYTDRLRYLGLQTLRARRLRSDIILVYKMTHGGVDVDVWKYFVPGCARTRGHNLKFETMVIPRLDIRRHFFSHRVIRLWNSLPYDVVNAPSMVSFKQRLHASNCLPY